MVEMNDLFSMGQRIDAGQKQEGDADAVFFQGRWHGTPEAGGIVAVQDNRWNDGKAFQIPAEEVKRREIVVGEDTEGKPILGSVMFPIDADGKLTTADVTPPKAEAAPEAPKVAEQAPAPAAPVTKLKMPGSRVKSEEKADAVPNQVSDGGNPGEGAPDTKAVAGEESLPAEGAGSATP